MIKSTERETDELMLYFNEIFAMWFEKRNDESSGGGGGVRDGNDARWVATPKK